MALCEEFKQSNEISGVVRYVVESIPQEKLELYAKFSNAFKKGGFRLKNRKGIKSLIVRLIESQEIIDDSLRKLLSEYSQCSRVLQLLASNVILEHRKELRAFFGPEQVLFAALLDTRENIRKEVIRSFLEEKDVRAAGEGPENEEDLAWARARFGELVWPLVNSFGTAGMEKSQLTTSGNFAVEKEWKDLRSKAKKLERVEKQLLDAKKREQAAEEKAIRFQIAARKSDKEASASRNRAENAEAELERNKKNAHSLAEAIVQTRLASEFARWLGGARAKEIEDALPGDLFERKRDEPVRNCGEKDFADLVSRAGEALDAQAQADSMGGVRSVFEKRLAILEKLTRKCNESLANAIRPTPGLLEVRKELEGECKKLQVILHPYFAEDTRVFDALAVAVNTAPDRQLPEWKHITDKLEKLDLLTRESHQSLLDIIHRRYATLHLQGTRELRKEDLEDPRDILRLALEGRLPLSLLIDGHNVLFALQSRYARPQDHHFPSAEARQWLLDDVVQMASQSPACRVILAYDGPERTDTGVSPNVRLIYSGGEGEHRADGVLLDEARCIVRNGERNHLLLVTNDRDLAEEALGMGVGNLAPTDLLEHFS